MVVEDLGAPVVGRIRKKHKVHTLLEYEATRLFAERATRAEPRFHVTPENAAAVVQICKRLDGIPLAIELAAARVKLFTPQQIAERLDDRFKLLTGGSRTAIPRQQTLRALIDWSYHSLNEIEQRSLRRLAVFAGGWTIEGAEAVITILARAESLQELADYRTALYVVMGWSAIFAGSPQLCRSAAESGLRLVTPTTNKKTIVHLQTLVGLACLYLGDFPSAEQALQTGKELAREMGYTEELAMILVLDGQLRFFVGGDAAHFQAQLEGAKAKLAEAASLKINADSQGASAAFILIRAAGKHDGRYR